MNFKRRAWRHWPARPGQGFRLPYTVSPRSGWPIEARWTRIWWVRPVSRRHSTWVKPRYLASTDQWVTAGRPVRGSTAIRLRSTGCRPMGASTVPPSSREAAHRHRLVHPGQGVVLKLGGQSQMGPVVFRGDDQAGGVPVNAVDDAGAQGTVDAGEGIPAVEEQGVHQSPVWMSGGGVDHHAHRLIHYDHIFVLVHHVQRDVLGRTSTGSGSGRRTSTTSPAAGRSFFSTLSRGRSPPRPPAGAGRRSGSAPPRCGPKGVQPLAGLLDGEGEGGHERCSWGCRPFSSRS